MACFGRWSCLLLALAALEETQAFSATWSQVTPSGSEPGARWGHKAVLTTSGACFFAGSDSSSNYFEDSWCFDLSARSWDEKFTNYGPLSRRKHSTAAYQERMWIFGGEDSSGQMSSELWELDPQDSSWTQLHISAATPPGRRGHSAVMTAGMLYVFGGYSSGGNLNDLWSIDTQAGAPTWQEISSISAPSAREDHSAVLMNTAMWIFGGSAGGGAMNDVWFVDLSQAPGFWTEISTSGTTVRRTGHSAHVHSDKMWVFGGHDGGGFSGALAYLDLTDQGGSYSWWEDTSSSGTRPAGRLRHAAVLDQSRLWVFGGSSSSGDLKDVWYVDLEAATTTTSVSTTISSTTSSSLSATISSTTTNTGTSSSSTATTSSTSSSSSSSSTSSTSSSTSSASSSSTSSGSSSMTTSASSTASMTSSLTASSSSSITSHSSTTTGSTSITMTLTSSTTVSRTVSSISSSTSSTSSTTWTDSTTSSASSTLSTSSSATSTVSTTNSVTSTVSTSFTSSTSTSSSPASTSATTSTSRTTTNTRTTATSSFTTSVTTSSTTSTGTTTTATGTTITVTGAGLELKRQEEAFEASASVERAEEVAVQELLAVLGNQTHSSETGILVELEPVETEAGLVKTAALAPEGLAVDNVTVSAAHRESPLTHLQAARMGKAKQAKDKAEPDKPLPPAKSIFEVKSKGSEGDRARCGELLGHATPFFTQLTSRGLPQCLRPKVLEALMEGQLLYELPIGDLLLRQESVSGCKEVAKEGLRGFWPHMQGHLTYCAFRNPRQNPSIYGGDALCSVETAGGRRKVGPKELLQTQKIMRADIVAAPGEEVGLDVVAARRGQRAVARASEWLKELLEAKASEPDLGFDWHVLASIQGGGDIKQREKACEASAAMPVAGYWIGGLGYSEPLPKRAEILQAVTAALPAERPRFLPLCSGTPQEVLQGVLLGIDVFELVYPAEAAVGGIALTFDTEMPSEEGAEAETEADCEALLSPSSTSRILPVRQLRLRAAECREDFGPISPSSPVKQYSRAYLYHLHEVHELLGTMLLAQHNFFVYRNFFEAIRRHVREGSIRRYATWFLKTQTCEGPPPEKAPERPSKRQKI